MAVGKMVVGLLAVGSWLSASAATDGTWVWGADGQPACTSPQTAADWSTAGNWQDATVAAGANALVLMPTNGYPFIAVDQDITVGSINNSARDPTLFPSDASMSHVVRYVGQGAMSFSRSETVSTVCGARFYVPVNFTCPANKRLAYLYAVEFCAPVTFPDDVLVVDYIGTLGWRRDLWANGTDATITNPFPTNEVEFFNSVNLRYVSPQGSEEVISAWAQTAGSAYLTLAQAAQPAIAAGTTVTGAGIPEGAFVKRIFGEGTIELSAAAMTTSTSNDLTFAAFTPNMVQEVSALEFANRSGVKTGTLLADKYRAEDILRVVVNKVSNPGKIFRLCIDTTDGFVPGTVVFRNAKTFARPVILGTAHVEFDGENAGWANADVLMKAANDVARVTIPAGTAASFKALTNVVGTLVKDGAGSLTAAVVGADDFNGTSGTISVEEGALILTGTAEAAAPTIGKLILASGATLTVPACGLRCKRISAVAGAQINGTGSLIVPYGEDLSNVTIGAQVKIVRWGDSRTAVKAADYLTAIPAAATKAEILALEPAVWVDVTDAATVTATDRALDKLTDVRGETYGYTSNQGAAPEIVTNSSGAVSHLKIARVGTAVKTSSRCLNWSSRVNGIRAVFKVIYGVEGGGQLLGDSNYWRDYVTADAAVPLFGNVPESYTNEAVFVVNGEARDWRLGYPYKGGYSAKPVEMWVPTVVEFYPPDATMTMKGFGWGDKYLLDKSSKGVNGNDRFGECLVFTNELTMTQKVAIRRYLMEKWFEKKVETGHEPDLGRAVATHDVTANGGMEVSEGTVVCVGHLTGTGTLEKSGAGTLYLDDAGGTGVSLAVKEGTVSIRSAAAPTASTLPEGRALHLDAEADGTLTNPGTAATSWADVRGAGYPTATIANYESGEKTVSVTNDAEVGHQFVDFGARTTNGSYIKKAYLELEEEIPVRTGFTVLDVTETRCGGQLFGGDTEHNYITDKSYYGLYRCSATPYSLAAKDWYTDEIFTATPQAGRACWRVNQVGVQATTYEMPNGCNLFACGLYEPIHTKTFALTHVSANGWWCTGGSLLGEVIYYTNKLSQAHVRDVEAYLAKRWQNVETMGYRAAQLNALSVAAGSTVQVTGGEPLTVGTLNCAGAFVGAVKVAAGGTVEIGVGSDGTVSCGTVSGSVDLSAGGTIRVVSADVRPKLGSYALFPVTGSLGTWTVSASGFSGRRIIPRVTDGMLWLDVAVPGLTIIVR